MLGIVVAMETFCGQVGLLVVELRAAGRRVPALLWLQLENNVALPLHAFTACLSNPFLFSLWQAFGAKRYRVVGIVLQRALLIVTLFNLMCAILLSKVRTSCESALGVTIHKNREIRLHQ